MFGTECGFLCWFNWKQVRFDSNVRSFLFWVWLQILVVLARLDPNFRFYRFYRAKWIERRFRTVLVRGSSSTWEGFHPPLHPGPDKKDAPMKKMPWCLPDARNTTKQNKILSVHTVVPTLSKLSVFRNGQAPGTKRQNGDTTQHGSSIYTHLTFQ